MYGFRFNILSAFFNNFKSRKIKNKIFIFFGGYDHKKYNLKILSILRKNNFHNFQFILTKVINPKNIKI